MMKKRKILCIFAVILIIFMFLFSLPASASGLSGFNAAVSTDAPVSVEIAIGGSLNEPGVSDYPTYYFTLTPVVSPSIMDNDTTLDFIRSQVYGDHPFISEADFYPDPYNSSLSVYNSGVYGYCTYDINNVGIVSNSSVTNYYLNTCVIYLRDFYVWKKGLFDIYENKYAQTNLLKDSTSNINFEFLGESTDTDVSIGRVDLACYPAGKPVYSSLNSWFGSDLSDIVDNGVLNLNNEILASDQVYDLYYVEFCAITLTNLPQNSINILRLNFNTRYYLNPFIDDYLYNAVPPETDNPALALMPYTSWLGEAVGGFMDFQLFKGFTLGGIFMTILAFSCVMWFLKLVAGG